MCVAGRAALCEPGVAANRAGMLLRGGRRFRQLDAGIVNHHSGVAGYSQFSVVARESVVKIDHKVTLKGKDGDGDSRIAFAKVCVSGGIVNAYDALALAATY